MSIRKKSCSRKNFSARLVRELFDEDTRKKSNVAGKFGKMKLNPVLMDYVKSLSFQHYPLENHEKEKTEWAQCVVSIDESNPRLNNKPKKLVMNNNDYAMCTYTVLFMLLSVYVRTYVHWILMWEDLSIRCTCCSVSTRVAIHFNNFWHQFL